MFIAYTGRLPNQMSLRGQSAFAELASATRRLQMPFLILPKGFTQIGKRGPYYRADWSGTTACTWRSTIEKVTNAVVYDAMYLQDVKNYKKERRRFLGELAKSEISFFNPVLPTKQALNKLLSAHPKSAALIPASYELQDSRQVLTRLDAVPRLWIKPVYGSGGRNIIHILNTGFGRYRVIAENLVGQSLHAEMEAGELSRFIAKLRAWRPFFLQEHIELLRLDKRVIDFRVTLQRGLSGAWDITAVTARTSSPDSLWTNYHVGGSAISMTSPGATEFNLFGPLGVNHETLAEIRRIAIQVGKILEQHFPLLGILGIDIGRDVYGKYHVYDCNSRPGRDILTDAEVSSFMAAVAGFAAHLMHKFS